MASPAATVYAAASGATIYGGRSGGFAWASTLVADQFVDLPNTAFKTWTLANIAADSYQGTDPFGASVNAYNDPGIDANGCQFFYGGGHGDGTMNGVVKFDPSTLSYSLAAPPTPASKYPPLYVTSDSALRDLKYPSGLSGLGFFRDDLTDPADVAYNTTRARGSTHMYAAAAMRGSVIHYFYGTYGEFDTATGTWWSGNLDLGAQLVTFRTQYNNIVLQQGTVAVYDSVTDRFFVTLVPGDSGGGWRSGIIVYNPNTRLIESIYESNDSTYGLILESMSVVKVGRLLYCFTHPNADRGLMNQGFTFNMDTKAFKCFVLTGDTGGSRYTPTTGQETIPAWYDGIAIRRWNYETAHKNYVYSVSLTPTSGTGTLADPYLLPQVQRSIGGAVPVDPTYIYSRISYLPAAGCAIVIPRATRNFVALKLS